MHRASTVRVPDEEAMAKFRMEVIRLHGKLRGALQDEMARAVRAHVARMSAQSAPKEGVKHDDAPQ